MNLEILVKYLIWVVFFGVVLIGLYFVLKKIGVM